MKRFLHGLIALPFLTAAAMAEPTQLTDPQLDKVSAGFLEIDKSNTSLTVLSIFQRSYLTEPTGNFITCSNCYLLIVSSTISIASQFGPTGSFTAPP